MENVTIFDWLFIITAILYNLLIAGLFIAEKQRKAKLVKTLGSTWLLLAAPLLIVFIRYSLAGKPVWMLVCLGIALLYMLVEYLLDYVFKYPFRERWVTHVPYILLEYAALFGILAVAIEVNETLGWVVGVCFWILMGSLIYLYTGKKKTTNS